MAVLSAYKREGRDYLFVPKKEIHTETALSGANQVAEREPGNRPDFLRHLIITGNYCIDVYVTNIAEGEKHGNKASAEFEGREYSYARGVILDLFQEQLGGLSVVHPLDSIMTTEFFEGKNELGLTEKELCMFKPYAPEKDNLLQQIAFEWGEGNHFVGADDKEESLVKIPGIDERVLSSVYSRIAASKLKDMTDSLLREIL